MEKEKLQTSEYLFNFINFLILFIYPNNFYILNLLTFRSLSPIKNNKIDISTTDFKTYELFNSPNKIRGPDFAKQLDRVAYRS